MSTVAEIEAAIDKLPPEDFRALCEWIARRASGSTQRKWSPEELTEGARQMLAESNSVKAQAIWDRTVAGFYGEIAA